MSVGDYYAFRESAASNLVYTGAPVPLLRWGGYNPTTGEQTQWEYSPQPDITTHELACLMPFLIGGMAYWRGSDV